MFGLFGSERTEVTAGIDINIETKTPQFMPAAQQPVQSYEGHHRPGHKGGAFSSAVFEINLEMIANYRRVDDISLRMNHLPGIKRRKNFAWGKYQGIKEPSSAGVNLKAE